MGIKQRSFRFVSLHAAILTISFVLVCCAPAALPPAEIGVGSSKDEVIASLGEPDRTQDFILPDEPFFGPQESLVNLVPAGTPIEEWVYEIGDEVLYVWFAGEARESREGWLVVATASYPKDAVF